ncbi:hypothetical protein [Lysobacter sp. 1R34A]|uniref:hypothetical protein n=1 Tax=Lysobacter sp. 1R34A TaxID=3445786 RepID=UPI003EEE9B37
MFRIVLLAIAAILVALAIAIALQPSQFRVARSIAIDAPPAAAFAQVEDFRRWTAWSPFEKLDPKMQRSDQGPALGVVAVYDWVGDKTEVTWPMSGERNFMFKAFGLFTSIDKRLGAHFEDGLAQLKAIAERRPLG